MILSAKGLKKIYGRKGQTYTAIRDIDLSIGKGEFVGVMGPSGSGKTTLLNIMSTIDRPSEGTVEINGKNIVQMNEKDLAIFRREHLGFIFQDYNLLDTLTIEENIALPLALAKMNTKEINRKVRETAESLGLEELLKKYPYEVSGGQKQRTAAARAVIVNPDLIFADEPTGALDSKSATTLLQMLTRLNEEETATLLMVTHDAFSASYCHRILFIKDGEIFTQLDRGNLSRKAYFQKILDVLSALGGGASDLV
ncbi:ABC transporter ATP-binding protein [Sporolactobacillus laevolacticus]|uniref:Bacitracin ABC transporter ATP-binding protein n=1 Tax=Sporolactobacillus laevolacticus DSM 442 TaxID=1395513 RepID=V6J058_9BACL|nr:ABC transporter ATP-binding protein [Sporolactobacillus laevolacticus]EST13192.1 bacitracin ABC transporter ATP-binding protein [Sporolactobacillus laevolacticus DSM 442]